MTEWPKSTFLTFLYAVCCTLERVEKYFVKSSPDAHLKHLNDQKQIDQINNKLRKGTDRDKQGKYVPGTAHQKG